MAIVMKMRWEGVTPEQYDEVRAAVQWESDAPAGGISHVVWFDGGAMHIVDVWDSAEAFQAFVDGRLMPGVAKVGVAGQPEVSIHPAHRVFDAASGVVRA
jgi:hypothetical protein